jgi:phenylpropionate dioxygenase-like ring-hydroxylating dioxygenase large terminal subunit
MHITQELNKRLTETGPGTPMGEVFRRYWIPALLSEEIPVADGAPVRVRLLGEDLVAFRDSANEIGLVEAYCAHRRAPLFYGRNEECGLRCVYHGWKFDTQGACVDMPSEPPYSKFRLRVAIKAYPTYEKGGIIWTYMGPTPEMPAPPNYEWLRAPEGKHSRASKTGEHANWLQCLEGGIDTAHSSFAHNNDITNKHALRTLDTHPTLEVDRSDYGFRYGSIRNISEEQSYVRVYQFHMPNQQARAFFFNFDGEMNALPSLDGHIWVPIDDENTFVYNWKYTASDEHEISDEAWHDFEHFTGRAREDMIPGTYWLKQNPYNDYLIDREVQRTKTFTGIAGLNTQDFALQEGMGSIVRRDLEALGSTDRAIQACREMLLEATDDVAAGRSPKGTDPATYERVRAGEIVTPRGVPWRDATKDILETVW